MTCFPSLEPCPGCAKSASEARIPGKPKRVFKEIEPTIELANTEFDPNKRAQHLRKIAQYYHDNAASLFLFDSVDLDGVKNWVKGYKPNNRLINWHEVSLQGKK